ncbi:MAG: hypothetical protein LBB66_01080, partial [Desulfovibrio sp.]|nr:hypothetical protein [Desulfovibrio sp.]
MKMLIHGLCILTMIFGGALTPLMVFAADSLENSSGLTAQDRQYLARMRERFMEDARAHPDEALYAPIFYKTALPEEARAIIGTRSLSEVKVEKYQQKVHSGLMRMGESYNAITAVA